MKVLNIKQVSALMEYDDPTLTRELKVRRSLNFSSKPMACMGEEQNCFKTCKQQVHCISHANSELLFVSYMADNYETYNLLCKCIGNSGFDYTIIDYTTILKNRNDTEINCENCPCIYNNFLYELTAFKPKMVIGLGRYVTDSILKAFGQADKEIIKGTTTRIIGENVSFSYREIVGIEDLLMDFNRYSSVFLNNILSEVNRVVSKR